MEALNAEHKIGEVLTTDACFYFFRGWLRVNGDGDYYVGPGHGLVVEVYDRCDSSIWFQLSEAEADMLALTVTDVGRVIKANG